MVGGELEPEEKEELAEKIGKLLQRDRMGVRTKSGKGEKNFGRSKQISSTINIGWPVYVTCKLWP